MSAPRVHVCYDDARPGMYLRVEGQDVAAFMAGPAWRAWLYYPADFVVGTEGDRILLDGELGLRECQEILEAVQDADGHGFEASVDASFTAYVDAGETYIRERSKVGLAIKERGVAGIADDPQLGPRYREFRDAVNAACARPLRDRQMLDAFFMASVGRAADFSVPGAGKTATVLGVFAYLRHLGLARRVVVVCPKNGFESWEREWSATFGDKLPLRCFSLGDPGVAAMTTERRKRALALDSGSCNLLMFNYESLQNYTRELHPIVADRTLLVYDEVHRVKAVRGKRAAAALEASEGAKYVIALTGTPIPNTYQDIYNMLHILYPEDYDTFFGYEPGELKKPDEQTRQQLNARFAPFFCRTNKDELGVPAPEPDAIVDVAATPDENTLMHVLYASCSNALALTIRTLQLESDPEMLGAAIDPEDLEFVLDQVGDDYSDIDYVDFSQTFSDAIDRCRPSSKTVACEELVADIVAKGRPVIVWCIFVRSINNLRRDLAARGIACEAIYGATPQDERREILDRFRAGGFKVLVTNPQTLAESVSLHSVCHDAVYFEYSYNLVHLLQSKDRIHRLGLPEDQKTRYYFMRETFEYRDKETSLDQVIYERLKEKEQTMLAAIDGGYLEGGYLDEDDLRIVYERLLGDAADGLSYR